MTEAIRFTTHYLIKNPDVAKYDAIEDFSSLDYKTEEKIRMAYIYDEETDILRKCTDRYAEEYCIEV